jgi:hypothetical protein
LASPSKRKVHSFLLFFAASFSAASDPASHALLEQIRQNVAKQITRSANYTCVETLERSYLHPQTFLPGGCTARQLFPLQEFMHDRLRLNLAVSKSGEIFSWYGESKFTAGKIDKLVQGGPISSGSFVGFLGNIFVRPGVAFTYRGQSKEHGVKVVRFDYSVPQDRSQFNARGNNGKSAVVAFHGTFAVDGATLQLTRLRIIADQIPNDIEICGAESEVQYQLAKISGIQTLVPKTYELRIDDNTHIHTVSKGQYSQCREYQAESTLRFDTPIQALAHTAKPIVENWLPKGLTLPIQIHAPIDSNTTFTGDPVEGILLEPVYDVHGVPILPARTLFQGVITQLDTVYGEKTYSTIRIQFRRAVTADLTYSLRSVYDLSSKDLRRLRSIYGGMITEPAKTDIREGTIVQLSDRLHLAGNFRGRWKTLSEVTPGNLP